MSVLPGHSSPSRQLLLGENDLLEAGTRHAEKSPQATHGGTRRLSNALWQPSASGLPVARKASRICWKRCPVADPSESSLLNLWDVCMGILLITTAMFCPFDAAFLDPQLDPQLNVVLVFECFIDTAFFFDMVLQFFIAYPDPARPERLVKEPQLIVKHYLTGWFVIDMASVLPVWGVRSGIAALLRLQHLEDFEAVRAIRLVRLLRLVRFGRLLERWHTSFGFSYANLSLAKLSVVLLLCCHWIACLWGALALHWCDERSWLTALRASKGGPDTLYEDPLEVYSISMYWAIITLTSIGYGDITPQTRLEYWVASLCVIIMAAIWAYVIGAVCSIVSNMQPHEMNFKRTMDDLNWLMSDRSMPHSMCKQLRRYFHETREMNRQRVEQDVIAQMSPKLQGEFAWFLHSRWIRKVWYFRDMHHDVIVWAARHLMMQVYAPDEEVLNERTLFIVRRGVCAFKGKVLVSGDMWGEDMLLSNPNLRDTAKARSLSYLSVLMLEIVDLCDIVQAFPEARAKLRWAQVQIAIWRGVQKISEAVRHLEASGQLRSETLSDEDRMLLFSNILRGKLGGQEKYEDYFGIEDPMKSRKLSRRLSSRSLRSLSINSNEVCAAPSHHSEREHDKFEALIGTVSGLHTSVATLSAKVDRMMPRYQGTPSNSGELWRAKAGTADLGPLIRQVSSSKPTSPSKGGGHEARMAAHASPRSRTGGVFGWLPTYKR